MWASLWLCLWRLINVTVTSPAKSAKIQRSPAAVQSYSCGRLKGQEPLQTEKITPIIRVVGCVSNKLACQSLIQLSVNSCKWEQIMILPVSLILTNTESEFVVKQPAANYVLSRWHSSSANYHRRREGYVFTCTLCCLVGWLVWLQDHTKTTAWIKAKQKSFD